MQVCECVTLVVAVFLSVRPGRWSTEGLWLNQRSQKELVEYLCNCGYITSLKVEEVMSQVDRFYYTKYDPYMDCPTSIGWGATISAPHMHADSLEHLKDHLKPGIKVLDIGSGSGYMTACMALMAGNTSRVIGVEHVQELVDLAKSNVMKDKPELLTTGRVKFYLGDGRLGMKDEAPFDVIYVGAAAPILPKALVEQLKLGGRMIIPVGPAGRIQKEIIVDKKMDGNITKYLSSIVEFVPLTDIKKQTSQFNDST